jgi:hypothetical protein
MQVECFNGANASETQRRKVSYYDLTALVWYAKIVVVLMFSNNNNNVCKFVLGLRVRTRMRSLRCLVYQHLLRSVQRCLPSSQSVMKLD